MIARKAVLPAVAEWMGGRRRRATGWAIGIEAEHSTVADKKRLSDLLPSSVRLKDAPSVVERARMVKDDEEIELIRAAVQLGASLFDRALEVLRPGVKDHLCRFERRNGLILELRRIEVRHKRHLLHVEQRK